MKRKLYLLMPAIILAFASCTFDDNGDPRIASWVWVALGIFVVIFIIAGVTSSNEMNKVKESLEKKGMRVDDFKKLGNYVGGHPDIDQTIEGAAIRKDGNELKIYAFATETVKPRFRGKIPIESITDIKVEDASSIEKRLSIGRLLLVGVFAFAWKKKKKNELAFVTIEWKQKFENSTVFSFEGNDSMQQANTARNILIKMCS